MRNRHVDRAFFLGLKMQKMDVLRAVDLLAGVGGEVGACEFDDETGNAVVFRITEPAALAWSDGDDLYSSEIKGSLIKQFKVDGKKILKEAIDNKFIGAGRAWYSLRAERTRNFEDASAVHYESAAGAIEAERDRQWTGIVASTDYFNAQNVENGPGWFAVGTGSMTHIDLIERLNVEGAAVVADDDPAWNGMFLVRGVVLAVRNALFYERIKIVYVPFDLVSASGKLMNFKSLGSFEKWRECVVRRRVMEIECFERVREERKNRYVDKKVSRLFDLQMQFIDRNPDIKIGVGRRVEYWENRRVIELPP